MALQLKVSPATFPGLAGGHAGIHNGYLGERHAWLREIRVEREGFHTVSF